MVTEKEFNELKRRVEKLEEQIKELIGESTKPILTFSYEEKMTIFAKTIGISLENLRSIIKVDTENYEVFILKPIIGKNEEEKQFKTSLVILTVYKNIFNRDEILSQKLRTILEKHGIKSLINLSTNLSKHKQYIIPKGKPKSSKYKYKLTLPGENKGKELIKELVTSDKNEIF
ncbi:MAG: hypothetical protein OH319_03515 [Candidatus Parvarchaeota archaeon]|nr:hypothetical protein [Candidatus Jingweiarchaeum tengchongense]MCW1304573.1 hypothetical protein [Candidatus Jingweiarchaeum tengchongense]MCW1310245.1 hypothetical protein [Candidatus Jingweiarchaeum tengchongense]